MGGRASAEPAGASLARRLRERRHEIEQTTLLRVHAVSALPRGGGPEYAEGLRGAVAAGIDLGLEGIERGEAPPPIPDALLAQARRAASSGVGLDTVLRRYLAGHALLGDFVVEEAGRAEALGPAELKCLLRSLAAVVDRLLAAVSTAYSEEIERRAQSSARRRAERVGRLLAGEPYDAGDLDYDLDACHLGLVAAGSERERALRALAAPLDRRLLLVGPDESICWAWLGGRRPLEASELEAVRAFAPPAGTRIALGEPAEGLAGWRLTHRQALAALAVARRGPKPLVRYRDVALLAATLQDDLFATSLRKLYLEPLEAERDDGETLRRTLCAYLGAHGSLSAAAAALSVSRRTVSNRLLKVEALIGRPVYQVRAELEVALRLDDHESIRTMSHNGPLAVS